MPKISEGPTLPSVVPYPSTNKTQLQQGFSSHSWQHVVLLMANNTMKNPQKTMLFVINMIFNKWNNAPFYSKPFLVDLKNSLLNVLIQCLCINTISLFRFIYNKAILTSIHRKLCSGFNNVSFHSGIHR